MSKGKKGWPVLGMITKNKNKTTGDTFLQFKLADNVTVLVDGKPVELNKYRTALMQTPVDRVERLIANGFVEEDKIEEKREEAQATHEWLRYEVILAPPKA